MRHSKFLYISRDHAKIKEFEISHLKIISYTVIFIALLVVGGKFGIDFLVEFSRNSDFRELEQKNTFLKTQIAKMQLQVKEIHDQLSLIESKDDELRMVMGLNSINPEVRDVGIGGTDYSYRLPEELLNPEESDQLTATIEFIEKVEREVRLEEESFTQLYTTWQVKEDSLRYMPAINPVLEGRITSDMGRRIHPILKRPHFHPGVDISAKLGTPVYATADGIIRRAEKTAGYGNLIVIDHIKGWTTKYGHLHRILVRVGQPVKRGDRIGLVGQTGSATAPHLHYEILYNGKNIDPKDYYFNDYELNSLVVSE
jgi:murein DD-endopeptidase MepM/ murein hydrolase activator NlpD